MRGVSTCVIGPGRATYFIGTPLASSQPIR